ncbi:excalibur calcium-binding domain-containing protein [Dactylosporangium sp. CA-233914]|uniref:excalibur calcium-binding domain-containing protein n=1 Tax=Dactylosporangium sp. CA-233914 TaxID=3239934 RepID=UPI003D915F61
MVTFGAQPRKNHRPLLIGLGSALAGLCVLCACVGFFAPKDHEGEDRNRERPAAPSAVTSAAAPTSAATTRAATTTAPPVVVVTTTTEPPPPPPVVVETTTEDEPEDVYYKNCTEARNAGAAPLYRGEPGYRAALDRDGDGVACER